MPKTLIWHGSSDGTASTPGTYTTAANWIDVSTGTAPGTGPASTDSLIFDRGNISIAPIATGHTLAAVVTTKDWKGVIAPGGVFNAVITSLRHSSGAGNYAGNITTAQFAPLSNSKINYSSGTITTAYFEHTDIALAANGLVTTFRASSNSVIDDLYNATGYTKAQLKSGSQLYTRRGGLIIADSGCYANLAGSATLDDGSIVRTRGTVDYQSDAEITDVVEVEPDGLLTFQNNAQTPTYSGTLAVWPGAKYNLSTRFSKVDPSTLTSYGVSENADAGAPIPLP